MAVSFVTSPINSGTQYQITDTSDVDLSLYSKKIVTLTAPDNTILYQDTNVALSTNTIVVDVDGTLWLSHLAFLQLSVGIAYVKPSGVSDAFNQTYLAPTTLNIKLF